MVLHEGLLPVGDVGVDVGLPRRAVAPLPVLLGVHHQHRRSDNQDEKDNNDDDDDEDERVFLVRNGSPVDEHGELLLHFKSVARAYSVSYLDRVNILLVRPAHIHDRQVHLVVVPGELEVSIKVSRMFSLLLVRRGWTR